MKFVIPILYIFLISSSSILATASEITANKRNNKSLLGSSKPHPPTPLIIQDFLLNLFKSSGFPIVDQIAALLEAMEQYDTDKGKSTYMTYECNIRGLKDFYHERVHDNKFQKAILVDKRASDDLVIRCRELKKFFKLYSPSYASLKEFLVDNRSKKEKYNDLIFGKYTQVFDYMKMVKHDKWATDWVNAWGHGLNLYPDYTVETWMKEEFETLPTQEEFDILSDFYGRKKCKSLKNHSLWESLKSRISAAVACLDFIEVCAHDSKLQFSIASFGVNTAIQIINILSDIVTGGITKIVRSLIYAGLALFSLYSAYDAYSKGLSKEMSVNLGKAAGYAIHIAKVLLLGRRRRLK